MIGTLRIWNEQRGFGFIRPDGTSGDDDAFLHVSEAKIAGLSGLMPGDRMEFDTKPDDRGRDRPHAINVRRLARA